jgi:hypothetical protein
MEQELKAKLGAARERLNSQQAGISVKRTHEDRVVREWGRGEQRQAATKREQFRNSLTEHERHQIEERIGELISQYPRLGDGTVQRSHAEARPASIPGDAWEEYQFLRELVT